MFKYLINKLLGNKVDRCVHDDTLKELTTYKNALLMIRYTQNEASEAWEIADSTLKAFE